MPKIPASEREAFYEARRAELAEVALRLWAEQGFDQTSMAAIAEKAGVSKGTVYLYFDSKQALLEEVMRRNSLIPNLLQLVDDLQNQSLEEAVHGFVEGAWRHLCSNKPLILVALRELPTHLDEAQQLVERVMAPGNQVLAEYLAARLPERAQEISAVIAVRGLLGMIIFTFVTQELLGVGRILPVPEHQVVRTISELFLGGLAGRPAEPSGDSANATAPDAAPAPSADRARGDLP
ncbi:MAG: helix-turn-helix domain-containing protein [Myxococcota bacterium]|nr:helix-turn-helix domain-containing protein [Myxococcota bacterium]